MNQIQRVVFIDVSIATAYLLVKHREQIRPGDLPFRSVPLIGESGPSQLMKDWKSGRAMLERLRVLLGLDGHLAELGLVSLLSVKAGAAVPWERHDEDYDLGHDRFHICLVPSPGMMLMVGLEQANIPVGQVTLINHRALHSAVNLGTNDAVHLVVDIVRPEPAE